MLEPPLVPVAHALIIKSEIKETAMLAEEDSVFRTVSMFLVICVSVRAKQGGKQVQNRGI